MQFADFVSTGFNPIVNNSSIFSNLADLLSHLRYGPNLPEFIVISFPFSGCWPITFLS